MALLRQAPHTGNVRAVRLGLIAVALAVVAACGSSHGSQPIKPAHVGTSASAAPVVKATGPTASGNKVAAQAEAAKLVAEAVLPPGAVPTKDQPPQLKGPATGTPGVSQLVDTVRYYRLPMSLLAAKAWFLKNPQPGFTQSVSEDGTDAGVANFGWQYDASAHFSWGTASLVVGISTEGSNTTGIRLDGLTQWIDPTPVRDTLSGRAIRVTVAGGCPASDSGAGDVSNPGAPDLDHQLLPALLPTAALSCTYFGMNGKAFALASSQKVNAAQASVAAGHIRALPLGSRGLGAHSCPMEDGRATIVVFSYAGRADVDVFESTSGCRWTSNGHIVSGDL
jgi:hypothetical protein